MSGQPAVTIHNLCQNYGNHNILKALSFEIKAGEYVGLVGSNGVGKTTLLKTILDFIAIKSGTIHIFNQSHCLTTARNTIAFLPEKFSPPKHLNGSQFLAYMASIDKATISTQQIHEMCEQLDLDPVVLSTTTKYYSKGTSQKLGLLACFLSHKPLLLLDEPMSGLDPKARICFKQYLQSIKATGQTLLFSSHLLADIQKLCDRIIVLSHAQICFDGSPAKLCEQYQSDDLETAYLNCIST